MTLTTEEKKHIEVANHNSVAILQTVNELKKGQRELQDHFKVGNNPSKDGMVIRMMKEILTLKTDGKWNKWLIRGVALAVTLGTLKTFGVI